MTLQVRRPILAFFVGVFVVSAPVILLYTAGYRLNISNRKFLRTGVIATASSPRGATVFVDGKDQNQKTPYVVQRLIPNHYTVTLKKDGYYPWEQRVQVDEGRTTYVTARLFAEALPEPLPEVSPEDVGLALPEPLPNVGPSAIVLTDNGTNIEVQDLSQGDVRTIAILPQSTYEILEDDGTYLLLRDSRQMPFIVAKRGGDTVVLNTGCSAYDWLPDEHALVWTDGGEVNIYYADTGSKDFITRQSEPIQSVAWHPAGDTVFMATATSIVAMATLQYESLQSTVLLRGLSVDSFSVDGGGKNLFLLSADPVSPGVFRLKLTR